MMWNTLFTLVIVAAVIGVLILIFPKDSDD
jgi:hypothetical protein